MADGGVAEDLLFGLALMHPEIAIVQADFAYASAARVIEPQDRDDRGARGQCAARPPRPGVHRPEGCLRTEIVGTPGRDSRRGDVGGGKRLPD